MSSASWSCLVMVHAVSRALGRGAWTMLMSYRKDKFTERLYEVGNEA